MATNAKSATVTLRSGVSEATLPDNRKMRASKTYAISLDDLAKISRSARERVIQAVTLNTSSKIINEFDGTNYAKDLASATFHNTVLRPPVFSGSSQLEDLGTVKRGFGNVAFMLVKADSSSSTISAGTPVVWGGVATRPAAGKKAHVVTSDVSDITDFTGPTESVQFAGCAVGTLTAGRFGWIQVAGTVDSAVVDTGVTGGDSVAVHATTDGTLTSSLSDEIVVIDLSGATGYGSGDSFTLTLGGQTTSGFVNGTNAAATDLQTGLEGLSTVGSGNVTVAGSTNTGPFTVTFKGSKSGVDMGAITISRTGFTGGTIVVSAQGGGDAVGDAVGTAFTTVSAGAADVELRTALARNLKSRSRDLFTQVRA